MRLAVPVVVRGFLVTCGLAALVWSAWLLPVFWRQQFLAGLASELEHGATFAPPVLLARLGQARAFSDEGTCNAAAATAALRIRLAVLEDPVAVARTVNLREETRASTRQLLACSPLDAYAWLVLAWLETGDGAAATKRFAYLRQSYRTSPNEASVALFRNRFTLAQFRALPDDLVADSLDEFAKLVETERLYPEMIEVFAAAPPEARLMLAVRLGDIAKRPREVFARALSERGIRATVPGIEPDVPRPWRN